MRGLVGKECVCWEAKGGRARDRRRQAGMGVGVGQGMCVLGRHREERKGRKSA